MVPLRSNIDPKQFEKILNKMFSPEWLRKTAADVYGAPHVKNTDLKI
jgi:hypothetical protein